MSIHTSSSPLAGKTVRIKLDTLDELAGAEYHVEDWWDLLVGKSWKHCDDNPACIDYVVRGGFRNKPAPLDDEVLYGKVGGLGKLVHINDIDPASIEQEEPPPGDQNHVT